MGYPKFNTEIDSTCGTKVLTVADSYYWGLFNSGLSRDVFNNSEFWFYNEMIYPDSYKSPLNVRDINLKESIDIDTEKDWKKAEKIGK